MNSVINRIQQDHQNTERLLQLIERETAHLEHGDFTNVPLLSDIMHYFVNYPDLYHHPLEDQVFAVMKKRDPSSAAKVDQLYSEHVQMAEASEGLLERTMELQGNAVTPRGKLVQEFRDYVRQYRAHMNREEQELLPAAEKVLEAADWKSLEKQFATGADPLFGQILQRQYQSLYKVIMAEAGK
ncbi:MAG: hemerythrin domain-containing protein [Gammaproteobacteria bacterium]|nr:hemerythrin domain-containing protein [Gammaproteobacteria bacterium]